MKRIYVTIILAFIVVVGCKASINCNRYEISHTELFHAIDSVMAQANRMSYFSVLENPYLIAISFYEKFITIEAMPRSITLITHRFQGLDNRHIGAGKYKNNFFLVVDYSSCDRIPLFFTRLNGKISCPLKESTNLIDKSAVLYNHISKLYHIKDNHLCLCEEEHCNEAYDNCCFLYESKWYDTWRSIARKSHCPVTILTKEYKSLKRPVRGYLFHFQYIIKNRKLENIDIVL